MHLEEANRIMYGSNDVLSYNMFREGIDKDIHLAFGYGNHRCMGGETGQLCAEILLEKLFLEDILRPELI